MRYRVTYCYEGQVKIEVEAPSKDQAERAGRKEADEAILHNLSLENVVIREQL